MAENPYRKERPVDNPYATYSNPQMPGWTWKILKLNRAPEKIDGDRHASAFCAVVSPCTHGENELGDTYLSDIGYKHESGPDILAECGLPTF